MLSARFRIALVSLLLLLSVVATSVLAQRQSTILQTATVAPPRPTQQTERQLDPSPHAHSAPRDEPAPLTELPPTPTSGPAVDPPPPVRAAVIDHQRFFYEPNFYVEEIQAFLDQQPGPLKGYTAGVGSQTQSFAEMLVSQTSLYSINPKVVLALIEQQSGLITNGSPSEDQQKFMLGFRGEEERRAGWVGQLRWAIRELHHAQRDFPDSPELRYADESHSPIPAGLDVAEYAVARVLAATTSPDGLAAKLDGGDGSFVATYTRLFGDPRDPPQDWPQPSDPFMSLPMEQPHQTTSFVDHEAPFLRENGSIVTYRGDRNEILSYDGHDGWDYAMMPPDPVLAAAEGTVVFAGNSDDGCGIAIVVILDHGNGYRTLYWHLDSVTVETGQQVARGEQIGVAGATGCVTGPHLHFQTQYLGRDTDPFGWCGADGDDLWANHPAGQTSAWLWRDVPSPCALPPNAVVVDTADAGFKRVGDGWSEEALGLGGTALYVPSAQRGSGDLRVGVWRPDLPQAGKYRVLAWVPFILSDLKDAEDVQYVVGHADGSGDAQQIAISQWEHGNWWADLGVHEFDPARTPFVGLTADDDEAGNNVWYDAVIWIPVE